MEIEITERKTNASLNREEVTFKIDHEGEHTPSRETVAAKLAAIVNADRSMTVLRKIETEFGKTESHGFAMIYENEDDRSVEHSYILERNGITVEE